MFEVVLEYSRISPQARPPEPTNLQRTTSTFSSSFKALRYLWRFCGSSFFNTSNFSTTSQHDAYRFEDILRSCIGKWVRACLLCLKWLGERSLTQTNKNSHLSSRRIVHMQMHWQRRHAALPCPDWWIEQFEGKASSNLQTSAAKFEGSNLQPKVQTSAELCFRETTLIQTESNTPAQHIQLVDGDSAEKIR